MADNTSEFDCIKFYIYGDAGQLIKLKFSPQEPSYDSLTHAAACYKYRLT